MRTDLSSVEQQSQALQGCIMHFLDHGDHSKQVLERLVKSHGGEVGFFFLSLLKVQHHHP